MITKDSRQVYFGLSTDNDKPSDDKLNNGAIFIEMDTSKIYFYNAADSEWLEWGGDDG